MSRERKDATMLLYRAMCSIVSQSKLFVATMIAGVFCAASGFAGPEPIQESKDVNLEPVVEVPTARESRGLITLEGPSGMFINPTSATLPQNEFILNYCVLFFDTDTDVVGHGILLSYGVRDWLEIGFVGNLLDVNSPGPPRGDSREDTFVVGGPMARIRLLRDREWWPELSLGGYVKWGSPVFNSANAFVAISKTIPIDEKGFLKTVTFQGGFREAWLDEPAPVSNVNRVYGGLEVQLPWRLFLIGEVTQRNDQVDFENRGIAAAPHTRHIPYAVGIQWRGSHFGCSLAALQNGVESRPGIYFGVAGGLGAEPVRTSTQGGVAGARR
jgi:hypothetical protein